MFYEPNDIILNLVRFFLVLIGNKFEPSDFFDWDQVHISIHFLFLHMMMHAFVFRNLPLPSDSIQNYCGILLKRFHSEQETTIRTKIAWILGKLCLTANFYPLIIVEDLIKILDSEGQYNSFYLVASKVHPP